MTWRERTVIAILLLVARIVASGIEMGGNRPLAEEIRTLATHISVSYERASEGDGDE